MKFVSLNLGFHMSVQVCSDDEKAVAACNALREAMASYDKYSNDKDKAVTVDWGDGCQGTYRLDALLSLSIEDATSVESVVIEREVWKRALEAKITARLVPSVTPTQQRSE